MSGTSKAYYQEMLLSEMVKLTNAESLGEEDSAVAKIGFYRTRLKELGVVYDPEKRTWIECHEPNGEKSAT